MRSAHRVGWAAVFLLVAGSFALRSAGSPRPDSFAGRLLGPITSLAASVQWVRAEHALRSGRSGEGYALAESALELQPTSTEAWSFLAHHFLFERASPASEVNLKKEESNRESTRMDANNTGRPRGHWDTEGMP